MQKKLSKILISVIMLGIFLLPLTANIGIKNAELVAKIEIEKARAQTDEQKAMVNWYFTFVYTPSSVTPPLTKKAGPYNWAKCTSFEVGDLVGESALFTIYSITEPCHQEGESQGDAKPSITDPNKVKNDDRVYFGCVSLIFDFVSCLVSASYYLIFMPISGLTALAAGVLDFFIFYSTSDDAYNDVFVTKAWGAVRDIANIFFIIALLYIAIKTILNLGNSNSKKLLTYVIIVALVINFSLFFTKVVIDASNVIAKIFYHQITPVDRNGNPIDENTEQRSVTISLVGQFDPVNLMALPPRGNSATQVDASGKIGEFFFVMLLCIGLMFFMIYIFLSVAMLFVARVISLWLSMIFSPIAFASHTVDFGLGSLGWKKWFEELFKNAFMAPIFIFFLYVVILFGNFINIGATVGSEKDWIFGVMTTIIPFMLVFVLLHKAKKLAVEYSGEMGSAVVKGAAVLGGMALGATALGVAAVGRNTVGAVSKYVQNDNARKKDFGTFGGYKDWSIGKKLNPFAYIRQAGKTVSATGAELIHSVPSWKKDSAGNRLTFGQAAQQADKGFAEKTHATSILDQKAKSEFGHQPGYENVKYKDLKETEQVVVKKEVDKDEIAKLRYGKLFKDVGTFEAGAIMRDYDAGIRIIEHEHTGIKTEARVALDPTTGAMTAASHPTTGAAIAITDQKIRSDVVVDASKANVAIGEFVQALRKGTYDARNLSTTKVASKGFGKLAIGIIGAVALGMRVGMKKSVGIEHGTGKGDFLLDLKHTMEEALKGVNMNTGGGHGGGGDSHTKEVKSVGH